MKEAEHDLFISHASEDKESVARPLSQALMARGWTVWLDELELTVGDSLSGRIDAALARSRFGLVVLSPAFFSKEWPKRELAGLAARETAGGSKVILPVWHGVDQSYLIQQSPTLADRLGANTSAGIEDVATRVSLALECASDRDERTHAYASVTPATEVESYAALRFARGVPTTADERRQLSETRPPCWETMLFAGHLLLGRESLDPKWHDHELQIPRGTRRDFDSVRSTSEYTHREISWLMSQLEARMRIFDGPVKERAFGTRGEHGDPDRIPHVARHVIETYELLMDWSAGMRNISTPDPCAEAVALAANVADLPIRQTRDFIDRCITQMTQLPALLEKHDEAGTTWEIRLFLELSGEPEVFDALLTALRRAEAEQ